MFDSFSAACARTLADVRGMIMALLLGGGIQRVSPRVRRGGFAWRAWGIVATRARRLMVRLRFAWQPWAIVEDVCTKSMADVHFAWQAWNSGCMSALEKELDGASAWQVWRIVHVDVAQRSFRVAGVGSGGS